jgi:hypothetical protein
MNSSLVVGQEVALTSFLLAVHRVIVHEESVRSADKPREIARETLLVVDHLNRESSIAMALVYATLLVIVYYNQKAFNCESVTQTGQRRKKAMVRMTDAILLAAILRLTSGIIHTLTASYSSDTVYALSVCGMIIHLLTCDYRYANGACDPDGDETAVHTSAHPRPAFLGGTVSLNDVFFSTSLLVSRIESDASSYAFVSLAVTLFAFYPATRHNIARKYPNTVCEWNCLLSKNFNCHYVFLTTRDLLFYFLDLVRGLTLFHNNVYYFRICVVDNNVLGEDSLSGYSMGSVDIIPLYPMGFAEAQEAHLGYLGYCSHSCCWC